MPDLLGNLIPIPEPVISGVFPIWPDFDVETRLDYEYIIHPITLKREQRILKRQGGLSWRIGKGMLSDQEVSPKFGSLSALWIFYDQHRSPLDWFYFYDPAERDEPDFTGTDTTGRHVARFKDNQLDFDQFVDFVSSGSLELIECNPSTTPIAINAGFYPHAQRYPRWAAGDPTEALRLASITDEQAIVHMLAIAPRFHDPDSSEWIRCSDRRVQYTESFLGVAFLNGLYLPRLLAWEVTQERGVDDSASFVLDDSDRVFTELIKVRSLQHASVYFFVNLRESEGNVVKLWAGYLYDYTADDTAGTFTLQCGSLHQQLRLPLPPRTVGTLCGLRFNDEQGGNWEGECPYDRAGSGGNPTFCDKTWDGPDGCISHGMNKYFQGMHIQPQTVTGKLNNTGFLGFWKKSYSTTSEALETVYGHPIPLIYGLGRQIVQADIFEVRDESEFFVASGIIGEGTMENIGAILLDGQPMHTGFSPVIFKGGDIHPLSFPNLFFALDVYPGPPYPFFFGPVGTIIDPAFRSARLAYASIRRVDTVGLETKKENHIMLVEVLSGLPGFNFHWFSSVDVAVTPAESDNPVGLIVDMFLRAMKERYPLTVNLSLLADLPFLTEVAQPYCAALVPKIGSTTSETEKRWPWRGVLRDPKPAIDWIREIASYACLDVVWSFGRLKLKPRQNDIDVPPPYQLTLQENENLIDGSFALEHYRPEFNQIKLVYSDEDYDFANRDVEVYDETRQIEDSGYFWREQGRRRKFEMKQNRTLAAVSHASQIIRLAQQLLLEELGGHTLTEQQKARRVRCSTGLLGLAIEVADVSRVVHSALPDGAAYIRWDRWTYNSDLRIELEGRTITPSMYTALPTQGAPVFDAEPVPGIPGNPGTGALEELLPPILTLLSVSPQLAQIGVSCMEVPPPIIEVPDEPPPEPGPEPPEPPEPPPPPSDAIYVAKTGNDLSGTGTEANPFLTINRGLQALTSGKTLVIKAGTYTEGIAPIAIPSGLSNSQHTTIQAFESHTVVINGAVGITGGPTGSPIATLWMTGRRWITIQRIIFDCIKSTGFGLYIGREGGYDPLANPRTPTQFIRFIDCTVKNTRFFSGVAAGWNQNGRIDCSFQFIRCRMFNNGYLATAEPTLHHGVYVSGRNISVDGGEYFNQPNGHGIHCFGHGIDGSLNGTVVRNTKCYGNGTTGIGLYNAQNGTIYNNLCYRNGVSGIRIDYTISNVKILNNTFYSNGMRGIHVGSGSGHVVQNNISTSNDSNLIDDASGTVKGNNIIIGDPMFVSTSGNDFHLQAGSPAINTGLNLSQYFTDDHDGEARPPSAPWECGAYEF